MIYTISTFKDNYSYIIEDDLDVIIIDPGEAKQIINFITQKGLIPTKIMLTHKHNDHTDGIPELISMFPNLNIVDNFKDTKYTTKNKNTIEILKTPGHTKDSCCLYIPTSDALFTGDTLFTGLCGRIIEGTYDEMFNSLQLLSKLPKNTNIYPGHEYLSNAIKFLNNIKMDTTFYSKFLDKEHPSLQSTIGDEIKENHFMTTDFNHFKELRTLKG